MAKKNKKRNQSIQTAEYRDDYTAEKIIPETKEEGIMTRNPFEEEKSAARDLEKEKSIYLLKEKYQQYYPYEKDNPDVFTEKFIGICKAKEDLKQVRDIGRTPESDYRDIVQREIKGFSYDKIPVIQDKEINEKEKLFYSVVYVNKTEVDKETGEKHIEKRPILATEANYPEKCEEIAIGIKREMRRYFILDPSAGLTQEDVDNLRDLATGHYNPERGAMSVGDLGFPAEMEVENHIPSYEELLELEAERQERLDLELGEEYEFGAREL